ncbi:hypothetical protein IAQ67_16445 [Paenibacillus peoriae]|uniref:Uncharacterized protein n=1 Tax=Paenibacillus peoriae TaxID=59893 RepID=A0A7H0Y318_9BACL|nr:hypothetical protein [Paenibacillus peoriae]QNR65476.1 hypothetical protein IAQ67_16445 [Paenibacillus peoriae]
MTNGIKLNKRDVIGGAYELTISLSKMISSKVHSSLLIEVQKKLDKARVEYANDIITLDEFYNIYQMIQDRFNKLAEFELLIFKEIVEN